MILRVVTLAGGLAGAAGLSQFPEYAQQYQQRLAGAVDALDVVVADFDRSAELVGMTRDQALDQMTGTEFLDNRRNDMQSTFERHENLSGLLAQMRSRSTIQQLALAPQLTDRAIANAALDEFKPAMPLTATGLICAGIGFVIGGIVIGGILSLLGWPFRRRARKKAALLAAREAEAAKVVPFDQALAQRGSAASGSDGAHSSEAAKR